MSEPINKVALVSGAAGVLGQALVTELLEQQWKVVATYHRQPPPAALEHREIAWIKVDVTKPGDWSAAFEKAQALGRLELLVNNAGAVEDELVARMPDTTWEKIVELNLNAAADSCRQASALFARQREGHMINISSHSAQFGAPGQAHYAAAKAGLIGLTLSLAQELGSRNVRANVIMPGLIPGPLTSHLSAETLEQRKQQNCLCRLNDPTEVARFLTFLAGTRNISGQVFRLDSRITPWT